MTSQEIYEAMEAHWLTFKENHDLSYRTLYRRGF
jgi:hypothetical protein